MEIKINKSARQCHGCQKTFAHEQRLTSALQRGPEGWLREDYCPECWNDERGEKSLCVWSAQYQDPAVLEQQPAEAFSPLRQAFYEAAEKQGREAIALAYLAGQLLRRQKVFRFIKQTIDPETEAAVMLFLDRIGNRMIEVHDPNLTTAELERGRVALLHRLAELEGTLDESETAGQAASPDAAESPTDAPESAGAEDDEDYGEEDEFDEDDEDDEDEDEVEDSEAEDEEEYEEDEFDDEDDDDDDDDDAEIEDEAESSGDGGTEDEYAKT